ncbi:MAG: heme ABC exporter ATP-binding protein CcmA [Chloroflexota bacterium]|jgi:heme exporter protein A|nr:heme ABC exporter ATP-binding protein CcmA [Chloroflexota bacterium]
MERTPERPSAEIAVRGLVKRYHYRPVLNDLSLTISDGDFCVLVGANGAGKTTLLRILASLVRADAGEIKIGNEITPSNPQSRSNIGYVGHQPMFYQDLTAAENLRHYARIYQVKDAEQAITEGIQLVGLADHQDKPLRTFSRGMQQRLSLARALLHQPTILLFDEPYTGLDQEAAHFLDTKLEELHRPGRAILLAAHRPQRLLTIASHIAWLKDGKITQIIPVNQLSQAPELNAYLQEVR